MSAPERLDARSGRGDLRHGGGKQQVATPAVPIGIVRAFSVPQGGTRLSRASRSCICTPTRDDLEDALARCRVLNRTHDNQRYVKLTRVDAATTIPPRRARV
jgi:hypothetical protein